MKKVEKEKVVFFFLVFVIFEVVGLANIHKTDLRRTKGISKVGEEWSQLYVENKENKRERIDYTKCQRYPRCHT